MFMYMYTYIYIYVYTQVKARRPRGSPKRIRVCKGLPSDPPIPRGFKTKWARLHKSVGYGESVLWNVPVLNWIICILHLNLRVTPYLIMHCVVKHLDPNHKPKGGDEVGPATQQVVDALQTLGTKISAPEKATKVLDTMMSGEKTGVAKKSYNGNACQAWHDLHMTMIDIAHPPAKCPPGSLALENRNNAIRVWKAYIAYWDHVRVPPDYGGQGTWLPPKS